MDKTKGARFKVCDFRNPSGKTAWRVSGYRRDGVRVRENFTSIDDARSRAAELEIEWLGGDVPALPKVTRLSHETLAAAERAFDRLGEGADADEILKAVDHWIEQGRPKSQHEAPRLDEAVAEFKLWLDGTPSLRPASKTALKLAVKLLSRYLGNPRVSTVDAAQLDKALAATGVTPTSQDVYRRGWSRFFSWCGERPRHWVRANPLAMVRIERGEAKPPVLLSVAESKALLHAAESISDGRMVKWFALSMFAGLRPFEAARVTKDQINLADGELRLEATQTKDGRPRVVPITPALRRWLSYHKSKPCGYSRKVFRKVVEAAGIKAWTQDVLRHTAASHLLRELGSYAQVSDMLGNSEQMLKMHYAGRVSTKETEEFFSITPSVKGGGK